MNNFLKTIYIHIGPHKTATTFLQNEIFPSLKDYMYIGRRETKKYNKSSANIYNKFFEYIIINSKESKNELIQDITNNFHERFIICDEWISSDYSGNIYSCLHWQEKLRRLSALEKNFNLKLIYCERQPGEALYSLYIEFITNRVIENITFNQFLKSNTCKFYNFKNTKKIILTMFTNSEIYIYNYEEFKTDYTQCLNFLSGVEKANNKYVNTKKLKNGIYEMKIKPKYIEKIYNMVPKIIKGFQNIYIIKIFWNILKKILYKKIIFNSIDNKTIEKINKKFEWGQK